MELQMTDTNKLPPEKAVDAALAKAVLCAAERKAVEDGLRKGFKIGGTEMDLLFFREAVGRMQDLTPLEAHELMFNPHHIRAEMRDPSHVYDMTKAGVNIRVHDVGSIVQQKCMKR